MQFFSRLSLLLLLVLPVFSCQRDVAVKGNTVTVRISDGDGAASQVRLQVLDEGIVRVSATSDARFADRKSLVVLPQRPFRDFRVEKDGGSVRISTARLSVRILPDGAIAFLDADGRMLGLTASVESSLPDTADAEGIKAAEAEEGLG